MTASAGVRPRSEIDVADAATAAAGAGTPLGVALVPLADIVAIGLMGYGGVFRLNYLWIFPVAWIATLIRA